MAAPNFFDARTGSTILHSMPVEESTSAYFAAVRAGDLPRVAELLRQSPELVDARCPGDTRLLGVVWTKSSSHARVPHHDPRSCTALHHAVHNGFTELVQLLLAQGADPNAVGYDNNRRAVTPLILAAAEGDVRSMEILLEHGADVNFINEIGCTALDTALEENSTDKACLLLQFGAKVSIHSAAKLGLLRQLRQLLASNPSLVHQLNRAGREPLECAAEWGERAAAELLLDSGATLTPRVAAALGMLTELQHFLDRDPQLIRSGNLLTLAAMNGRVDAIAFLLARGADPNGRDHDNACPLHNVAMSMVRPACADSVAPLLGVGADPTIVHRAHTPLARARATKNEVVVQKLSEHGVAQ